MTGVAGWAAQFLAVLVALVTGAGGVWVATLAKRATDRKTQTDGELGGAALAIRIANRADRKAEHAERRLDAGDAWRREVTDVWWPAHRRNFDRHLVDEIRRLDPSAAIPDVEPMPRYVAPAPIEGEDEDDSSSPR